MATPERPELQIALDKVCFVIVKAKEFDAKEAATDEDSGSNAADDGMRDVLEDLPDDAVVEELTGFIDAMTDDERIDLVTLMWLGRDDGSVEDWMALRAEAEQAGTETTGRYLIGTPLVADYLGAGLAKLDLSCEG
ncbi:MAG: DUF3775 domain-containing protein [Proteobacteria bacterium]|nr:DUF3775 domain-containing protein [Pseudomonadota bacterium]